MKAPRPAIVLRSLLSLLPGAALALLPLATTAAQAVSPSGPGVPAVGRGVDRRAEFEAAEASQRALLRALNGDLGFPDLGPVTDSSPRNSLIWEDRRFVNQEASVGPGDGGTTLVQVIIPSGAGGTGTTFAEIFWYQLPTDYVPGDARPMVIAWHGYGFSANSVQLQSTVDEECAARGWIYMAVTGLDPALFGTPPSQQHVEVAIQYMLDNFSIDADRLYMTGWSMGGGACASFAARHRDPDGIMIAALGIVGGTFDWAQTYTLGDNAVKTVMQNPLNFGGSVAQQLFRYQQVSTLYNAPGSYPPAPGTLEPVPSMGDNLDNIPVYLTWDTGDPLIENPPAMGAQVAALIASVGGSVETHPVSGTVDPVTLLPKPHSWAVLDEVALFDFFATKSVDRTPADFVAQLDRDEVVSYAQATQAAEASFSYLDGSASGGMLALGNIVNVESLTADVGAAGLAGILPLHVTAQAADAAGFTLRLTGFTDPPSYLLRTSDGSLVTGVDSDPFTGTLIVDVPGLSTLDVQVISEPWVAKLSSTPDPVAVGGVVDLDLNAYHGTSVLAYLIITFSELLTPIKDGFTITASVLPPALLVQLPLNTLGDIHLTGSIPANPALVGLRLVMQAVTLKPNGHIDTVSNLWGLHVE